MNIKKLQDSARDASELLRALSNEKRLMLLCQLIDGEKSVGALCEALGLSQSNASQQLALLRKDGLVKTRRDSQTIYYSLADAKVRHIIKALHKIYCE